MIPKATISLAFVMAGCSLLAIPKTKPAPIPRVVTTPATASMKPASTVAEPHDVAVVAVPYLEHDAALAMPATEGGAIASVVFNSPPAAPARIGATSCSGGSCGPAMIGPRYQPIQRRRLFGRFR